MSSSRRRSLTADAGAVRVFSEVGQSADHEEELTVAALDEIRQLRRPPLPVRRTLEVVHLVLHADKHSRGVPRGGVKWENVQRTLAREDLAHRLQSFDVSALRQNPNLARDLQEIYFRSDDSAPCSRTLRRASTSTTQSLEALSPDRVRYASTAAATLFSWAARAVEEAATQPALSSVQQLEQHLVVGQQTAEPEEPESDLEEHAVMNDPDVVRETLTVGVWMTCPLGHGLEVGCVGPNPMCAMCANAITRGGDSASCRGCNFFVCVTCRRGAWLDVDVVPSLEGGARIAVDIEIVGLRWLRVGEQLPEALSLEDSVANGAFARWGAAGAALPGTVQMLLSKTPLNSSDSLSSTVVTVSQPRFRRMSQGADSSPQRGSVFGLTDARALNAGVLIALSGPPGPR